MKPYPVIWQQYLATLGESVESTSGVFAYEDHFCREKEWADKTFELVLEGRKRATCGNYELYRHENEALPKPGDLFILTDFDGSRKCILRVTRVSIKQFCDVTEEDAGKEGEGDGSLEFWRLTHRRVFEAECRSMGLEFHEALQVVLEEFEVEYRGSWTPT